MSYSYILNLQNEILEEATEYRTKNFVKPIDLQGYKVYLETGERLPFERQYFARRKQLTVLALDIYIRDSKESIPLLEEVIFQICNEYSWALPAHMPFDEQGFTRDSNEVIDLFAAETAQTLAEIVEIIGDQLSDFLKQLVYEAINQRVFIPFEKKEWHWERLENNWSAVIASCIGLASLSILPTNSPRQTAILERLKISFDHYLKSFADDGVCAEGVGYWAYGFGYYCYFAEKYTKLYQDDCYITSQKVKNIAEFPFYSMIAEGQYIPYSDSSKYLVLPSGLLCFCEETFNVKIPPVTKASSLYADHCYRWAPIYRNLTWTTHSVENELASCTHYFQDAQWGIVRNTKEQFIFSAKGGSNQESHNHNDIGHFIIGDGCDLFLTDLGAGEYTRDYFGDKRYTYLPNRALGHTIPLIQDTEQKEGKYQAHNAQFHIQNSRLTEFSMELMELYPEVAGLQYFKRKWLINEIEKSVSLTDIIQFEQNEQAAVTENFVSLIKPTVEQNHISWKGQNSKLTLEYDDTIDRLQIQEEVYSEHDGTKTKVYLTQLKNIEKKRQYFRNYVFELNEIK